MNKAGQPYCVGQGNYGNAWYGGAGNFSGTQSAGKQNTLIGVGADNTDTSGDPSYGTAVGCLATVKQFGIAVGRTAAADGNSAIAIGPGATASAAKAYMFGYGTNPVSQSASFNTANEAGSQDHTGGSMVWTTETYDPKYIFGRMTSTSTTRLVGGLFGNWASNTDASRTGRITLSTYYTSTVQEGIRVESSSTAVKLGFFGASAVTRPTLPAAGTVTADDIRAALISLGLCA